MASAADPSSHEIPDWLNARSRWVAGPSWLLSGALHLMTAFLVWQVAQSPGCQARRGEQVIEGREVGIFVREPGDGTGEPGASPPAQGGGDARTALNAAEASPQGAVAGVPSVPLSLPSESAPKVIGMGAPPAFATQAAQAAGGPIVKNSGTGGRGDLGTGPGNRPGRGSGNGTSMYGIPSKGKKFVYVIDRSSSMTDVLLQAKNELMASLRRLDESQSFQVIFFNDQPHELENRFGMFHGTEADRRVVENQLAGIGADGGTRRERALDLALTYHPDVIYFLTDADNPMTAAAREDIRRRLRGAQINCVEFGIGPAPAGSDGKQVPNFLHKLAAESGGGHLYVDITGGANR
ncbi:hypothetical protein AYO47_03020 [Planctomyces sp. SCGC AG-212-M04]|nr:hypothetical protein AYO47_03020 [Planctomyces sp. SCGC AG-212-M04]